MKHRPNLDHGLHRLPRLFHSDQLFVGQRQVFGGKFMIIGMDDPKTVMIFPFFDGSLIQPQFSGFKPSKAGPKAKAERSWQAHLG